MSETGNNSKPVGTIRDLKRYLKLRDKEVELKAKLSEVQDEKGEVQKNILSYYERQGITSLTVDGKTMYVNRQLWARTAGAMPDVVAALEAVGMGTLVKQTVSTQSLSSYCRELDDENKPIPDPLAEFVKVYEKFTIGVRSKA